MRPDETWEPDRPKAASMSRALGSGDEVPTPPRDTRSGAELRLPSDRAADEDDLARYVELC